MEIDGLSFNVSVRGRGIPLLWTHGLLGSMELEDGTRVIDWRRLERCAEVARYDARGHGGSGASVSPHDYRWEILTGDMLAVADRLGFSKFFAGGQSMGAVVSLFAALSARERLYGLILLTPPALWDEGEQHREVYDFAAAILERYGMAPLLTLMKERHDMADRQLLSSPALRDKFIHTLRTRDPRVLAAVLRGAAMSLPPPRERIKQIDLPALILAWTGDEIHPVSAAEKLHHLLPGSRLLIAQRRRDIAKWTRYIAEFLSGAATAGE